jgi:hypothetical protein
MVHVTAVTLSLNGLMGSKRAEVCDVAWGRHVAFCDALRCCRHIVTAERRRCWILSASWLQMHYEAADAYRIRKCAVKGGDLCQCSDDHNNRGNLGHRYRYHARSLIASPNHLHRQQKARL